MNKSHANIDIKQIVVVVVAIIALAMKLMGSPEGEEQPIPDGDGYGIMLYDIEVIDGDTIKARLETGQKETIRLLGIDAPEKDGPYTEYECYGREATDALDVLLNQNAEEVFFIYDSTQGTHDRYDRILAHVFADDVLVSEYLAREGYVVSYPYGKKSIYAKDIEKGEEEAQNNRVGLWDVCIIG